MAKGDQVLQGEATHKKEGESLQVGNPSGQSLQHLRDEYITNRYDNAWYKQETDQYPLTFRSADLCLENRSVRQTAAPPISHSPR